MEQNQESAPESVAIPYVTTIEGGQLDGVNTSSNDKNHDGDDSHLENDSVSVAVKDARASDGQDMLKDTIIPNSPVNLGEICLLTLL
ncbi:hypothetical protein A2U01_0067114 [Trifolium medium]|uniref:Uncharacterized protein n=1 Tax=Trifolium medium TaxID=97028 RepID=A0A392SDB9_9FABA|nr:hypothetical protein [Trifolium medium]